MPIFLAFNFTVVRGRFSAAEARIAEAPIISGPSNAHLLLPSRLCTSPASSHCCQRS